MTAFRVIFDGTAFILRQAVSLPTQSEALVLVDQNDPSAQAQFDAAWGRATLPQSHRAWDEE